MIWLTRRVFARQREPRGVDVARGAVLCRARRSIPREGTTASAVPDASLEPAAGTLEMGLEVVVTTGSQHDAPHLKASGAGPREHFLASSVKRSWS